MNPTNAAWASLLVAVPLMPFASSVAANPELTMSAPACQEVLANVAGTVLDASSRQPVAGARVVIPITNGSALTDAEGRFNLPEIEASASRVAIRVEMVGYVTSTVNVPVGKQNMSVQLQKLGSGVGTERENRTPEPAGWLASDNDPMPFGGAYVPCEEGF